MAERPELYFQALVRLTQVLHRRLPEPPGFDRRQYRADVLQRLQERAENAKHRIAGMRRSRASPGSALQCS